MLQKTKHTFTNTQPLLIILLTVIVVLKLLNTQDSLTSYWSNELLKALGLWVLGSLFIFAISNFIFKSYARIACISAPILFISIGAGINQSITTILFSLSIYALGRHILNWLYPGNKKDPLWIAAFVIGTVFYLALIGITLHYPINFQLTYGLILATPIIFYLFTSENRSIFYRHCSEAVNSANEQCLSINSGIFYGAIILIGFVGSFLLIPSVMHDDHVLHLAMWSQVEYHHQFHFDVSIQKWSAAPFALDSLHTFISIIAQADGRSSLNLLLFTLLILSFWHLLSTIINNANYRFIALSLFASTPMLSNLLLSLQTEIILALLTTIGIVILFDKKSHFTTQLLSLLLVCCILSAVKLPAILIAATLFSCFLIDNKKKLPELLKLEKPTQLKIIFILTIGLLIAIHSYFFAYLKTGNPLFPLFNEHFNPHSNISGTLGSIFVKAPTLSAYTGFFFDSSNYFESKNFIAGFQYFLLPVLGVISFLLYEKKVSLIYILLPILVFGGAMFIQIQYWRYVFPILPLASVFIGALLAHNSNHKALKLIAPASLVFYIFLNIFYLPGVSHFFNQNHLKYFFNNERLSFQHKQIPEILLNEYINENYHSPKVLMAINRPYGATLWGTPIYASRMAPDTFNAIKGVSSKEELLDYLDRNNIEFIYWNDAETKYRFPFQTLIKEAITSHFIKEKTLGEFSIYKRKK